MNFKGDWDNLEGRVVIYSGLKREENGEIVRGPFHALCVVINEVGPPKVESEGPNSFLDAMAFMSQNIVGQEGYPEGIYVIKGGIKSNSEEMLSKLANEVLYMGDYFEEDACQTANKQGYNMYMLALVDQRQKRLSVKAAEQGSNKTFRDFMVGDAQEYIGPYVWDHFVEPMIDAQGKPDSERYDYVSQEFARFSEGSPFQQYAQALSTAIRLGERPHPNNYLIDVLMNHIQGGQDKRKTAGPKS